MVANLNLDLSKAFDLVRHDLLLDKLEYFGIRGTPLQLLQSYLTNRKQIVQVNTTKENGHTLHTCSDYDNVLCGIPQGSILGPLLFITFTADLDFNLSYPITMYADDTTVMVSSSSICELERSVGQVLEEANSWFDCNSLIINVNKTSIILLNQDPKIDIGYSTISNCKVLGLHIDSKLNWSAHVANINKKLDSSLFALRQLQRICNEYTLRTIYFALFHSHLRYGILYWGNSVHLNDLLLRQKKALRIILNLQKRDSCRNKFKELRIMTVVNLFLFVSMLFVYEHRHTVFTVASDIHNHATRCNSHLRQQQQPRCGVFSKSFLFTSVQHYNKLPNNIKEEPNALKFKKLLKVFLIDNVYYCVNDYMNHKPVNM